MGHARTPRAVAILSLLGSLVLIMSGSTAPAADVIRAFPGAEGWGATTPGGRGGKVVWVTNLNDSGPGSLREALATAGPRMILFRVAGVIHLKRPLILGDRDDARRADKRSFVTVAGHSAPGGGITVADRALVIGGGVHDVVIRHVRFRNSDGDGISVLRGARRVVLDHCSISWGTDENIGFLGDNQEITIAHCINAECLHHGGHPEGPHSKGFLISRGAHKVTLYRNFITGNVDRNPQFVGNNVPERHHFGERFPVFDMRNNLIYNGGAQTRLKFGARANIVANRYVYGPRDSIRYPVEFTSDEEGSQAYLQGNVSSKHHAEDQWDLAGARTGDGLIHGKELPPGLRAEKPFAAPNVTTVPATQVADRVLASAGALPRDETDRRLIREFLTGTGQCAAPQRTHASPIPAPESGTPQPDVDGDGMPDAWERAHDLKPEDPQDGRSDRDDDGYTNLEEYLNEVAAELDRDAGKWYRSAAGQVGASSPPAPNPLVQFDLNGSLDGRAGEKTIAARLGPGAHFLSSVEGKGVQPGDKGPAVIVPLDDRFWRPRGTLAFRFKASHRISHAPQRGPTRSVVFVDSPPLEVSLRERNNLTSLDVTAAATGDSRANQGQMFLSHLKADRWYHIAMAWDAAGGKLELYLNGELQQNLRRRGSSGGWTQPPALSGPLQLGGVLGEGERAVKIAVDSIRLYEPFLNEKQIAALVRGRQIDPLAGEGRTNYTGSLDLSGYRRSLVFDADFSQPLSYVHEDDLFAGERRTRLPTGRNWVLEGSGRAWTEKGRLHVETTGKEGGGHLVLWNTKVFPNDVLVEWEMSPQDPQTGLTIVFFAARPRDDPRGSIFDLKMPKRYGLFTNYHSGALDSYHCSYWAPPRRTANLRKNHGFLLASCGIDRISGHGGGPHKLRLLKDGGKIRLESRGRLALVFDDDGRSYGPVWTDGYIGLRQMAHSRRVSYSSFKVWRVEKR